MKVIQINCVYGQGSTGKIIQSLHESYINMGIDAYVIYGRSIDEYTSDRIIRFGNELYSKAQNFISRLIGYQYSGCYINTSQIIKSIKKINPDVVHLHCINGHFVNIYRLMLFLKNENIKTVVTNHAEFFYTGNCGHSYECEQWINGCKKCNDIRGKLNSYYRDTSRNAWEKMKNAFNGFDNIVITSVSPWLMNRSKLSSITGRYTNITILNGININKYYYHDRVHKHFQMTDCYSIDTCYFFYSSPDIKDANKGFQYLIKIANDLEETNIRFLVAAIIPENYSLPSNIIKLGYVSNEDQLAYYYSMSRATLLLSKRETFSMVCAESLCCGAEIVGFESGGPEGISIPDYSYFFKYGDVESIERKLIELSHTTINRYKLSQDAHLKYDINKIATEYINCYET